MARRGGAAFADVPLVAVEQLLEQAEPGAVLALAEVGVAVQALQRPPQPTDRGEVVQSVPKLGIPDGPPVLPSPHTVLQPCRPGLPAKPCIESALSGQQRSLRLQPKRCRYAALERGHRAFAARTLVRD